MSEAERRAAIREWMDRIRLEDGNMPRNWMYWRRLYLEPESVPKSGKKSSTLCAIVS